MSLDELEQHIKERLRQMKITFAEQKEYSTGWPTGYNHGINDAIAVVDGWFETARKK